MQLDLTNKQLEKALLLVSLIPKNQKTSVPKKVPPQLSHLTPEEWEVVSWILEELHEQQSRQPIQ